MDTIQELQNFRTQLIQEINVTFDRMIQNLRTEQKTADVEPVVEIKEYESIYPLAGSTGIFKGKKPVGVIFPDGTREDVRTWKNVVEVILKRCNKVPVNHMILYNLCGKVSGRERVFLATGGDEMRSPLKIDTNIYIETHYDTETLLRILTTRILESTFFDYKGINIAVRND